MVTRLNRSLFLAALCALVLNFGLAQFTQNPFFEHAEALGTAHGLETLEIRLAALAAVDDLDTEFSEEIENTLARDVPRFRATLEAQNPDLAAQLLSTLEELGEALESGGENPEGIVREAHELTQVARGLVIPDELAQTPAFAASLMTLLLLAGEGVAERFEEAAEGEGTAYAGGWAALERVKVIWSGLEPLASETQQFEVNDMLKALDSLFPSPELPESSTLIDPEAAEDPAQRIAGFLEELADASLFPDRDLGQMVSLTQTLVQEGCDVLGADGMLGRQRIAIAGFYYAQYLGNTIELLVPDAHEGLEPIWAIFSETEGEERSTEEGTENMGADASINCQDILESLDKVASTFGG